MAEGLAQLRVCLLGSVELYDAASGVRLPLPGSKTKELLALLASERRRTFSRDELVEHLWAGESQRTTLKRAQANLRGRIAELRRLHPLLRECIRTYTHGYCFVQHPAVWVDIEEFAQHYDRGRALAQQKRFPEAIQALEQAVQLYRGDFFAEEPYAEWAIAVRAHWRECFREARALLAACHECLLKVRRRPVPQIVSMTPLPWVGRERELAVLRERFARACAGHVTGVLIAGESGVGKTRLVQEFLAALGRSQKLTVLSERADAAARTVAYYALQRTLEPRELSRSQLRSLSSLEVAAVAEIIPKLRAHWPDLPRLAELPPQHARRRRLESLVRLLGALAKTAPIVLFLDDLQWADPSTLEFLGYLLAGPQPLSRSSYGRGAQGVRGKMLFVGCYRSEEVSPELVALHDQVRQTGGEILPLERLSRAEVERLLHQAQITAPQLAQRLYDETQGNPFFIATVLQNLISAGLLRQHHGRWGLTVRDLSADYQRLFIPATLQEAIRHRLAALDKRERQCLELASVLGQEFEYELLEQAWPGDGALAEIVAQLLHKQILRAHATADRVRYAFSHEKIREFISEQLAPDHKQRLHERALRALEVLSGREAHAALLAQHAYHAGLWREATEYALSALKRAVKEYHWHEGLELARLGLEAAQQLEALTPQRFELLAQRVEIYDLLGRHEEQSRDIEELERLAAGDPAKLVLTLLKRSALQWKRGAYAQAAQAARHAKELAEQCGDLSGQASALNLLGNTAWAQGDYAQALKCYEGVLALRRRLNDRRGEGPAWGNLGAAYYKLGRYSEAQRCHEQNLQISREVGDRRSEAVSLSNLGSVSLSLGDYSDALRYHRQALAIRTEIGDRSGQANSLVILGHIHASLGCYKQALRCHRQAHRLAQQLGEPRGLAIALSNLGHTCFELKDFAHARRCYEQSLEIYRRLGARLEHGLKLYDLGTLSNALGEHPKALELFVQAEALFGELGTEVERAMALSAAAMAYLELGKKEDALRSSSKALAILEQRAEGCEHQEQILFYHYRVLQAHQDSQARQYLQKAYDELMRRAQKIGDRRLRRSFLHNVALHREIIEAYHGQAEPAAREKLRERLQRARVASESVRRVGEVALALAQRNRPITAEKLCELTGYSRPTVNRALTQLCRLKVLKAIVGREGGRGRKATFIVAMQIDNAP